MEVRLHRQLTIEQNNEILMRQIAPELCTSGTSKLQGKYLYRDVDESAEVEITVNLTFLELIKLG